MSVLSFGCFVRVGDSFLLVSFLLELLACVHVSVAGVVCVEACGAGFGVGVRYVRDG